MDELARAHTPPPRIYFDPAVHGEERLRIFGRTWQFAAHLGDLAEIGSYVATEIGGEPIVVVRDTPATLRAFYNVCRHRAGPVAVGCGRRQTLQCRYHGWTYRLDGRLLRAPDMEGALDFAVDQIALHPVRTAIWGPLVLVNLDDAAPPLATVMDGIDARTAPYHVDRLRFVTRREYTIQCNWKVYVDNYLEGYHLPFVHPGLYRELDYDAYRVEVHGLWSLQHAPLRAPAGGVRHYDPAAGHDEPFYFWIFPNLMLNAYQGQLQTNVIVPLGPDRTRTIFDWYAPEGTAPSADLLAFSDEIQQEDITICEAVQKNLRSRVAAPGRYSPLRENGVHHFHALWNELMGT